jgi:hypothetical protein
VFCFEVAVKTKTRTHFTTKGTKFTKKDKNNADFTKTFKISPFAALGDLGALGG